MPIEFEISAGGRRGALIARTEDRAEAERWLNEELDELGIEPERIVGRHSLPQRMHSQEAGYSPALKETGGYSSDPQEPEETPEERKYTEEDKREKCDFHGNFYNLLVEEYNKLLEGKDNLIEEGATLEDINGQIRQMNKDFAPYGCPPMPEIEPEPPATPEFASLNNRRVNPKR